MSYFSEVAPLSKQEKSYIQLLSIVNKNQSIEASSGEQINAAQPSFPELTSSNESTVPVQMEPLTNDKQNKPSENILNSTANIDSSMEVHHPHHLTHKKKWSEYLLEFLMLFLAVFLGFLAENIRETSVERHREHEYVQNMVQNLKDDTAQLNLRIPGLELTLQKLDSLARMSKTDLTVPENLKTITRLATEYAGIFYSFKSSNATIVQLKSGNLRLIQTGHAADSILKYDYLTAVTERQEQQYNFTLNDYIQSAEQVFDVTQMLDTTYMRNGKVTGVLPPPVTINKETLRLFSNKIAVYYLSARGYLRRLRLQLNYAKQLIAYLKTEYHLQDE